MWTAAFDPALCMKLRSREFRQSFSIQATLNVCGRHLSRLPRKHHLLFSWKRNAWWQSRVSKRVDSVCLEYWLVFFRHSISIAWNWTFFQTCLRLSIPGMAWSATTGRVRTARRTSGLFLDIAGRFFVAAAVTPLWHLWFFIKSKMLLIISWMAIVKLTAMPCLAAL